MNPDHLVPVEDFSEATLRNIVAQLEESTTFEHFVYRESELDEVCRLVEDALLGGHGRADAQQRARWQVIFEAARDAHDLVGNEDPARAAERLRQIL
jgi:hypothetical protein